MVIDKKGALRMGRDGFILGMFQTREVKDMGEKKGLKYLNKLYDEFERTDKESEGNKPSKSVRRVRKG